MTDRWFIDGEPVDDDTRERIERGTRRRTNLRLPSHNGLRLKQRPQRRLFCKLMRYRGPLAWLWIWWPWHPQR